MANAPAHQRFITLARREQDKKSSTIINESSWAVATKQQSYRNRNQHADNRRGINSGQAQPARPDNRGVKKPIYEAVTSPTVICTPAEAIATLVRFKNKKDTPSKLQHDSVPTGEFLSYPIKCTYHLGGSGRYVDSPVATSFTKPNGQGDFVLA
jgi:hypothetical protein